jgi:hypothetical protein
MRFSNFYDIQQKADWFAIDFEVDCNGNKGLMVGGSPRVCGETQGTFVLLEVSQCMFLFVNTAY